jgi:uncharacterized membrane protein
MKSRKDRKGNSANRIRAAQVTAQESAIVEESPITDRTFLLIVAMITAAAAVVRCSGLFGDLWLDEIWAIVTVRHFHSPLEILTTRHEINHPLYSLFLYLLGSSQPPWLYRFPSLLAGVASVGLAGLIGRLQWRALDGGQSTTAAATAGVVTAILAAGSYILIHYSSEARGYSFAVCLGFLAWYALLRGSCARHIGWILTYVVAVSLAVTAHATAAIVVAAGTVWTILTSWIASRSWTRTIRATAEWHAAPLVIAGLYYRFFLNQRVIGGADENPLAGVIAECATYTLGLPVGKASMLVLAFAVLIFTVSMIAIGRKGIPIAAFYVTAVVIAPSLLMIVAHYQYPYPRHFIVSAAFGVLALGVPLTRGVSAASPWRLISSAAIVAFLVGASLHVAGLIQFGRGEYSRALSFMAAMTPTPYMTIASDHDFRNPMVISYYSPIMKPSLAMRYFAQDAPASWPTGGVQWFLVHTFDSDPNPLPQIRDGNGHSYRFSRLFRYGGLSGWSWIVYENSTPLAQCGLQ